MSVYDWCVCSSSIVVSVSVFGVKDFVSDSMNGILELLSPSVHPLLLWAAADPTFHFCTVGTHIGGWVGTGYLLLELLLLVPSAYRCCHFCPHCLHHCILHYYD